jgi:hypothetical protein
VALRVLVLVNLGLFDPSTSGPFSQAHFFDNWMYRFAQLNHNADGIGFLLGCKFSARFLGHLNIFLRDRLFGNVHFFVERSAIALIKSIAAFPLTCP